MRILRLSLLFASNGFVHCFRSASNSSSGRTLNEATLEALAVLGKTASDFRLPGSLPFPNEEPGTDMLPGIEHIVFIIWENHSWDNIYGTLDREDTNGLLFNRTGQPISDVVQRYNNGSIQHMYEMPNNCAVTGHGPTQNWQSSHQQMNNDSMDSWVTAGGEDKPCAMGFWTASQLPTFHSLGQVFPVCDAWHASCPGQTWPNRMYQIAGTSLGLVDTSQVIPGRDPAPAGNPKRGTIFNLFEQHNITWTNYVDDFGVEPSTLDLFGNSSALATAHGANLTQFFTDAAAGTLPQFSFIDENGNTQSMENPQNTITGDTLLHDIAKAVGNGPKWDKTAFFFNFDEHGGYYDHVWPPRALAPDGFPPVVPAGQLQYDAFTRYGFRVPAVLVSPYGKKNFVNHAVHDHTSFLAFLEYKWNLPALTFRDANANNMVDWFDFDAMTSGVMNFPDINAIVGAPGNTTEALECSVTGPGVIPPVGSMVNVTNSTINGTATAGIFDLYGILRRPK